MDRLTWQDWHGSVFVDSDDVRQIEYEGAIVFAGEAVDKLFEYEDIGFSPKEIKEIFKNVFDAFNETTDSHIKKIDSYDCRDINEMVFATSNMKKKLLEKKNDCENFE